MRKVLKLFAYIILVSVIVGVTYLTGFGTGWYVAGTMAQASAVQTAQPQPTVQARPTSPEFFKVFWEAWDVITREYYGRKGLDPQKMTYGAIKGMLESLGDPHTYFLTPSDSRIAQEDLQGSFEGIGATIEKRDNKLLVVAPIEGTPADKAGLKPGDHIVRVDDKDTAPLSLIEAVSLIRGKAGTVVKLTVLREGEKQPLIFEITRARIEITTVRTRQLEEGIAYIRLSGFSEPTSRGLAAALQKIKASNPKGLILDLRNNPGGYLSTSVEVASQFLKEGLVVYEQDAEGRRRDFRVRPGGQAVDIPMVVLVNKGTASASEIVAGAIQDAGRAPLIGEKTFGKGSVQTTHTLSDGSSVHVTVTYWFTPKGRQIQDKGIEPDIEVPLTEEDVRKGVDPQLERAIEYLRTGR